MKEEQVVCMTAREIVEHIENNGGGAIDRNVWRMALEQGFVPIDKKVYPR